MLVYFALGPTRRVPWGQPWRGFWVGYWHSPRLYAWVVPRRPRESKDKMDFVVTILIEEKDGYLRDLAVMLIYIPYT